MDRKIPILAIVGFLGSGKTSLLNHILKENQGLKIGVIVNDFGAINVDALLVARQTDSKLELSNGCVCCEIGEGGLDSAIDEIAHAGAMIDYIVIEASGLAEPRELAKILHGSRNRYTRFDSLVAVVDAANVLDTREQHPDFFAQLDIADTILLSKVDLITKPKLKEVRGYLEFINARAHILEVDHGQIDTRILLDPERTQHNQPDVGDQLSLSDHAEHAHQKYATLSWSSAKPLNPQAFELYMAEGLPKSIYRAKGFVYFGMKGFEQKFVFQLVGSRHELTLDDDWRGQTPKTDLVFIGQNIDESKLRADLEKLIDPHPEDIRDGSLMDIFRYRK